MQLSCHQKRRNNVSARAVSSFCLRPLQLNPRYFFSFSQVPHPDKIWTDNCCNALKVAFLTERQPFFELKKNFCGVLPENDNLLVFQADMEIRIIPKAGKNCRLVHKTVRLI